MPRGRKKVITENITELIMKKKELISELSAQLKIEKAALKDLEKQEVAYKRQIEEQKMQEDAAKVLALLKETGASVEELAELLKK